MSKWLFLIKHLRVCTHILTLFLHPCKQWSWNLKSEWFGADWRLFALERRKPQSFSVTLPSILLRIYRYMGIGQPRVEKRDGRFSDLCLSMSVTAFLCILHATLTGTFSTTSCTHVLSPVIANTVRHTFASILIWKCLIHVDISCYFSCFCDPFFLWSTLA